MPASKKEGAKKEEIKGGKGEYIAVIRVRGTVKVRGSIEETLKRLRLTKPNHCVILEKTPTIMGMINKAKDYITWGEVGEEVIELLENEAPKEGRRLYRLQPPVKGYGRKGIKTTYSKGGALGYRGKDIEDLIKRMLESMKRTMEASKITA